jgi:hypothetical protein
VSEIDKVIDRLNVTVRKIFEIPFKRCMRGDIAEKSGCPEDFFISIFFVRFRSGITRKSG